MRTLMIAVVAIIALSAGWLVVGPLATPRSVMATQEVVLNDGDTYTLTASMVSKVIGGKTYKMLAYNGSIPGPTIRVSQGAHVTIVVENDTDVPTALHSHGVRMENRYDGAPPVTQREIAPGASFTYELTFPDAGIYWYHPHVQEGYTQELGLYGAFVVTPSDPAYLPPVDREEVVFLDDILIEGGKLSFARDGVDHALMGRYGNVMLTNGQERYALTAQAGEVVRLYLINAANARPFNVSIEGLKLKQVGGDNGAYEHATWQDSIILGPSERATVDVMPTQAGTYTLVHRTPDRTYELGVITVGNETATSSSAREFNTLQSNQSTTVSIAPFEKYFTKSPEKTITLTVDIPGMGGMGGMNHGGHGMMMGGTSSDGIEWEDAGGMGMMGNAAQWHIVDTATGKQDMDINWTLERGTPVKIEIYNDPDSMHPMQHPMHFHGQRFLVVARDGIPQTNLVWKDSVLVRSGERVEVLLDPSNPGDWMAHCHIAEHLEAGMMMHFRVE